jgi:ubiquinone/menaquinone biosynthesis C-methylase UbiE
MYDRHLERISNRPGERIQVLLAQKLFMKFINNVQNYEDVLTGQHGGELGTLETSRFAQTDKSDSKDMDSKKKLIEIGTGAGRLLPIVLSQNIEYVGIEPTESMRNSTFELSKKFGINKEKFKLIDSRLPNLSSELDNLFDYAYMSHVIEHASSPQEARVWLESVRGSLKLGGYILIISPNIRDYGWRFWDVDWSHGWPTTPNNIGELLEDLNFEVVRSLNVCGWSTSKFQHLVRRIFLKLYPEDFFDWLFQKVLNVELLGSGFSNAFLRRNCFVIARKI